jgi:hypothetical protein
VIEDLPGVLKALDLIPSTSSKLNASLFLICFRSCQAAFQSHTTILLCHLQWFRTLTPVSLPLLLYVCLDYSMLVAVKCHLKAFP